MNIYNNTASSVRHILDLDSFSRGDIELVLKNATAMEEVLKRGIKDWTKDGGWRGLG